MTQMLPRGWYSAKVREIGAVQLGRQRSPDVHRGVNMRPYLRVANVYEDRIDLSDVMEMHFEPHEIPRYELKPGDILLNEGQSRELVGRPAMYRGELPGACFTNSLVRFQPSQAIEGTFALQLFRHWLKSGAFQSIGQITTNIAHLGAGRFADMDAPVPPLNEQRRIVAKLEALQTRSRRAREALDAVPPLLEKLRQSILAAAFRGDLTKDWRAKHPDVEPASKLLERIRVERRRKWEEAELAKMTAKGKAPTDDKWKAKYKEPEAVDTTGLPELPAGWCWANADELFGFVTSGSRGWAEYYAEEGPLFIRIGNLEHHTIELDLRDQQHVHPPANAEGTRTRVVAGDVLISITADLGMIGLVREDLGEAYVNQHIALARPIDVATSEYVALFLAAPSGGKGQLLSENRGVTKAGLGLEDIRRVHVALAPLTEMTQIVDTLKSAAQRFSGLREAYAAQHELGALMDRAVLAKAFRGELVPQDPNDEPAEAMLARLRGPSPPAPSPARGRGGGERKKKVL